MTAQTIDDTALVGPIVAEQDRPDWWCFAVVRGQRGHDGSSGASNVTANDLSLLHAARASLLVSLRLSPWLAEVLTFDDELDLAKAAAERWPRKFASLVVLGEVMEAGGGQA
jgi:hypothetical protein